MSQSNNEMSSFLAELAGEATQKLQAIQAEQQDRQAVAKSVNGALDRTFQFFNLLNKHLNALEPDILRTYALDGRTQISKLKWKRGMVDYRKQSTADNALLDHVFCQMRLTMAEPVVLTRRWDQFDGVKKDLQAFGLKTIEDLDDIWRSRPQKDTFQARLEPEFFIRLHFQGNYEDGTVELSFNNLESFGAMKGKLKSELLQPALFDEIGRFLMGRSTALPQDMKLTRDYSSNL